MKTILILVAASLAWAHGSEPRTFLAADAWAFQSAKDDFGPDALNLRTLLNEPVAGITGFVRRSGASFVRGDGQPIRFWGVVSDGFRLKPEEMERHAKWLAKRGVNMVRVHTTIASSKEGSAITDVDEELIDGIQRWVAICKAHGIYVTISPYWAFTKAPASWGIEGYAGRQLWGLLFFEPRLQDAYRGWVRELYTRPNPHGVPLKDEPAVAIAQVQNEDSLLFWTFDGIQPVQKRQLGEKFFAWAVRKYGSPEAIRAAWEGAPVKDDDWDAGVFGFSVTWELTGAAPRREGGRAARLADQLEFLTTLQRDFNASMEAFYKNELRIGSLTNAMNWKSADQVFLDDAERYTYTPMDVLAVNVYTGGVHEGKNNGYRIDPGHVFTNGSVLRGTALFPAALKQVAGHPMAVTETAWVHPNLYQSEGPFLMTAWQAMNGVDITYWFAFPGPGHPEWMADPRAHFWPVGDSHATGKWFGNFPMQAGQFPALALAFRRGDIAEASSPAVFEERSLADLWNRRVPVISEAGRFDPNRDTGLFAPESTVRQEIDRQAFFVGPVEVRYGGDASKTRVVDLSKFIDSQTGEVRSMTGQLMINLKRGVATIDAPRVQGVSGFLREAGGTFQLGSTRWTSSNDYAALVAVSLDGEDLTSASRVLVQAGTVARMSGFTVRDTVLDVKGHKLPAEEIVHNGRPPWLITKTRATLSLNNPSLRKATALDENLRPVGTPVAVRREGEWLTVELPTDALYAVIE